MILIYKVTFAYVSYFRGITQIVHYTKRSGLDVIKLEYSLKLKIKEMIGCLRMHVRKQPIIVLYREFEDELKFYNLEAWSLYS